MANYEKPVVISNEDNFEGVYAASGDIIGGGDNICWSGTIYTTQDWNGAAHVFEVYLEHSKAVTHFSEACTVQLTFNNVVTKAWAEGAGHYSVSGEGSNTLTVTRTHHANGEYAGDTVTYKVFAVAGDEAMSKSLSAGLTVVSCDKTGTPNFPDID